MRQLKSTDVFAAFNVINIIGADEAIKALNGFISKKGITQEEAGMAFILYIVNLGRPEASAALFNFLSGPLEKTVPELKEMDAIDFLEEVRDFIKSVDVERWKSFFGSLAGLLKRS